MGVATGEAAQNRVTFKQLLQAEATDVCQIDAVRLGGVNECLVRASCIHLVPSTKLTLLGRHDYGPQI